MDDVIITWLRRHLNKDIFTKNCKKRIFKIDVSSWRKRFRSDLRESILKENRLSFQNTFLSITLSVENFPLKSLPVKSLATISILQKKISKFICFFSEFSTKVELDFYFFSLLLLNAPYFLQKVRRIRSSQKICE